MAKLNINRIMQPRGGNNHAYIIHGSVREEGHAITWQHAGCALVCFMPEETFIHVSSERGRIFVCAEGCGPYQVARQDCFHSPRE